MMKPAIELQDQGEAFYFIANYHSMTSLFDAAERRRNTWDVALDFLACGLDPKKALFFRQSDVPEVTEVGVAAHHRHADGPAGAVPQLQGQNRAWHFAPATALFAYPVLMAADILIYDSNIVPVGRDQKQHVEVTRDIAIKFNEAYGQTFVLPEPQIREEVATVPGLDGQKMSKSYGNAIEIFGEEKAAAKKNHGPGHGQPHAAGTKTGRGKKPGHSIAQAGRRRRDGQGIRGPLAGGRFGLRRFEKGAIRELLELFRRGPGQARRVGGQYALMSSKCSRTAQPRPGLWPKKSSPAPAPLAAWTDSIDRMNRMDRILKWKNRL